MFGFLADVRNYSAVPPIVAPRGAPDAWHCSLELGALLEDAKEWCHSFSWVQVSELLAFDYDQTFEDRRVVRGSDFGATCEPGQGVVTTYREFLGAGFFEDLERLAAIGPPKAVRVVFWFDG